jgi:hypothetical protein
MHLEDMSEVVLLDNVVRFEVSNLGIILLNDLKTLGPEGALCFK